MANELTLFELVNKDPKALVATQTTEQQAQTYIALDVLTKALKEEERQALLNSGLTKYEWRVNGMIIPVTISKTSPRVEKQVKTIIDTEGLIALAKKNGWEIPMTEPQIDYNKLEMMDWYQNHVSEFTKDVIVEKTISSVQKVVVGKPKRDMEK